jgi:hypothetical protein
MDGFTYVNMFATKGIEYLLAIGYLILFIGVGRLLAAPSGSAAASREDKDKLSRDSGLS